MEFGWTWLGITAVIVFVGALVNGYRRGFVKEVVSALFVLLSFAIVWVINPYVNDFVRENTHIYEMIQEKSREFVASAAGENDNFTDQSQQDEFVRSMDLPKILQDGITENNTGEAYKHMAVSTFGDYVSGYLANIAVNSLSFVISYILATLLIRMITYALNILARLPVIRGINKMAGAGVGGIKFILFLWIAMLILTIFCNTEIGQQGLKLIDDDTVLSFLYDHNIFIKVFTGIFYH